MEMRKTLVAGLVAGVVVACSGPARDMGAGMLEDAGNLMEDAGRSLAGAGAGAMAGVGGLLADAGQGLSDAGQVLRDGGDGSGDGASAQDGADRVILEADCDTEATRRIVQPDDSWTETTKYYASANGSGSLPEHFAGVVALLCGWDNASPSLGAPECDGDVDCVDSGDEDFDRAKADCVQTSEIEIEGDKLTVSCGLAFDRSDALPSGGHWNFVRFVVPTR